MMRRLCAFAVLVLFSATGCNARNSCAMNNCGCFSLEDCSAHNICFLGSCQAPGYNISNVYLDLLPAAASGLVAQQDAESPRNLADGLNLHVGLRATYPFLGQVQTTRGNALGGALKIQVHPDSQVPISLPSSQSLPQPTVSISDGFSVTLVPGIYDLTFVPTDTAQELPPLFVANYIFTQAAQETLVYPDTNLVTVSGSLNGNDALFSPISGALISGVGASANGSVLLSTATTTDSGGRYRLIFPPEATVFNVTTRPSDGNLQVPFATFTDLPVTQDPNAVTTLTLGIPPDTVSLTATLFDSGVTPVPHATLYFEGGVGTAGGKFATTSTSDNHGVATVTLIPGSYSVIVAPASDQNNALLETRFCVNSAYSAPLQDCDYAVSNQGNVVLHLNQRVAVAGRIMGHAGKPVAAAHVVFTLQNKPLVQRQYATTTDTDGNYSVLVDPSRGGPPTEYEVVVEPDANSGLPRHRELLRVDQQPVHHDMQLYAASLVYGRIMDPNGLPQSDVTIALYSAELGSAGQPLLVGLGKSTTGGEFVIPLPTAQ